MNPQAVAELLASGWSDLITFDRPSLATLDLHTRIVNNWPLNPVDSTGSTAQWVKVLPTYRP